jgi:ABC-2 type transport system ATP-binding protein
MNALEVRELRKVFPGRRPVVAVDGVSFSVGEGEIVGLLGPNGAGKTTIIKCALGLVRATGGRTAVFGADTDDEPRRVVACASAVLEGSRNTYWRMTAWENVAFFASLNGVWHGDRANRDYLEGLVDRFGLHAYRDTQVRELSTGFKQKVAVVAALARRTPLVFLDEPTLGLDVQTTLELQNLLPALVREEGRTLVVSSHNMNVVQAVCSRVVIVSRGRVVADDQVGNLLSLFRSRSYRLKVAGALSAAALEGIRAIGAVTRDDKQDGATELVVQLSAAEDLYRLCDALREAGVVIDSITQDEPNLEQAFLEIVRRGGVMR